LNILVDENLAERSMEMGNYMMGELKKLDSAMISTIRGSGLFIGIEIDPALGSAREICERLMTRGLLSKETHETVVRLAPPLIITKEQIDWAVDQIGQVLQELDSIRLDDACKSVCKRKDCCKRKLAKSDGVATIGTQSAGRTKQKSDRAN
ncbi:MAG: aminotransferase class III-fold pyridoxal phosphate-dependent enzyme, partial [Woeseiales bacterium]